MSLLRDRRLAALLGAEVISSLGTQMTWLALPWFVLRTTGSPQRMTWVLIAEIVPIALLGFWGGAIAARIGTRRTMLICDLARVPLLGAIPLLQSLGLLPFPVLLALVAASGVFIAPYMGVQRAVVPELVGEEQGDVATATALFQAANRLTILARAAARRCPHRGHRRVERPLRRRRHLPRLLPDAARLRASARGARARRTSAACSRACASCSATGCCGCGRRR